MTESNAENIYEAAVREALARIAAAFDENADRHTADLQYTTEAVRDILEAATRAGASQR